jgi:hypothetical protein
MRTMRTTIATGNRTVRTSIDGVPLDNNESRSSYLDYCAECGSRIWPGALECEENDHPQEKAGSFPPQSAIQSQIHFLQMRRHDAKKNADKDSTAFVAYVTAEIEGLQEAQRELQAYYDLKAALAVVKASL